MEKQKKWMMDSDALPWRVDMSGVQLIDSNSAEPPQYDMNMRNYMASTPLPIKSIRELRQQCVDGGSTLEVIFDLLGTGLTYKTAANSAIYATNRQSDVEAFATEFEFTQDLDKQFCFTKSEGYTGKMPKLPFPTGVSMTIREALKKHVDLTSPLTKKQL